MIDYNFIASQLEPGSATLETVLQQVSDKARRAEIRRYSQMPHAERVETIRMSIRGQALRSPEDKSPVLEAERAVMLNEKRISLGQSLVGKVVHDQVHGIRTV